MSYEGVLEQSGSGLKELLKSGEEIVGYIYPHTPLELFLAHGLTPSLLRASPGVRSGFEESLQTFACSYVRNLYNQRINDQLPNVIGILFPSNTCDSLQNLTDIWKIRFPEDRVYRLTYPVTRYADDDSVTIYLKKELELLSKTIESTLDRPFSKDRYSRALTLIGGFRLDAQFLYAARVVDPTVLSYGELSHSVRSFLSAPVPSVVFDTHEAAMTVRETLKSKGLVETTNSVLESLLHRDFSNVAPLENIQSPRILVVGGMIEPQAIATIINSIEGYSDVHLVLDHLSFGFKTVFTPTTDIFGNPYEEMARSIINAPGEPTQEGLPHRMQFLKQLIKALKIDGIIICEQSFCDPDQFEAPSVERVASEANIRTIRIPIDPELSDRARIEVRVQTFLESMGA